MRRPAFRGRQYAISNVFRLVPNCLAWADSILWAFNLLLVIVTPATGHTKTEIWEKRIYLLNESLINVTLRNEIVACTAILYSFSYINPRIYKRYYAMLFACFMLH